MSGHSGFVFLGEGHSFSLLKKDEISLSTYRERLSACTIPVPGALEFVECVRSIVLPTTCIGIVRTSGYFSLDVWFFSLFYVTPGHIYTGFFVAAFESPGWVWMAPHSRFRFTEVVAIGFYNDQAQLLYCVFPWRWCSV